MARGDLRIDLRRLRRSALVSGAGDGLATVALLLLAAGVTREPQPLSLVIVALESPWVLVALVRDRVTTDRRTVLALADTLRALAVGAIGLQVVGDGPSLASLCAAAAAVGLAAALHDLGEADAAVRLSPGGSGSGALTSLGIAGLIGLGVLGLAGGGFLFEVSSAVPTLLVLPVSAVAALLDLSPRAPLPGTARRASTASPGGAMPPLVAGLAAASGGALLGVLLLFALADLGLGAPAFGLLLAGIGGGTVAGGWAAPTVGRILGLRTGVAGTLALAAVALALAASLAEPLTPYPSAAALVVAAAASAAAGVLVRAAALPGPPGHASAALRRLHLAEWIAVPLGALGAGLLADGRPLTDVVFAAAAIAALAGGLAAVVGLGTSAATTDLPTDAAATPRDTAGNTPPQGSPATSPSAPTETSVAETAGAGKSG